MNDCSAVRSGDVTPSQLNTAIAKSIATAKATARQRHRSMACRIRRRTVSDIVRLRSDKPPHQSIEAAIDLSSIAHTGHFGALQRARACLLPRPCARSLCAGQRTREGVKVGGGAQPCSAAPLKPVDHEMLAG